MAEIWTAPEFQEIGVGGECTAYAGTDTEVPQSEAKHQPVPDGVDPVPTDGNN